MEKIKDSRFELVDSSKLNSEVKAEAFLLPSITAKKIDELWNKIQKLITQ